MKVISCIGAKGGSGKSSVTMLLAWELAKNHKSKVTVFDADVQGTCLSAKMLNPTLPFEVLSISNKDKLWLHGKEQTEKECDYLIIDGNPRSIHEDPELIQLIASLSDLSLLVSRPSPRDIKAQIQYVDLLKKATKGEIRFVWNFFQKNTGAHKEGMPEGEKLLDLKSLKTTLGLRIAFQDIGYSEGYIGDLGNKEALAEAKSLGNEVRKLLNGKK